MKKIFSSLGLAAVLLVVAWGYGEGSKTNVDDFSEIYHEIADVDFCSGKLLDKTLILYDKNGTEIMSLRGEKYDRVEFDTVRKDPVTNQVMFVTGGSVDDEYGVLYEGKYGVDMDGIHRIERIGGNSFYFQTN